MTEKERAAPTALSFSFFEMRMLHGLTGHGARGSAARARRYAREEER